MTIAEILSMNFTIFWLQVLAGSWCPLSQVAGVPGLDTCYYTNVLILMITGECTSTRSLRYNHRS